MPLDARSARQRTSNDLTAGSTSTRQHVNVELVAVGVGHLPPPEPLQLPRLPRLQPPTAQALDLGRRRVQVLDDQIQVQPARVRQMFDVPTRLAGLPRIKAP